MVTQKKSDLNTKSDLKGLKIQFISIQFTSFFLWRKN